MPNKLDKLKDNIEDAQGLITKGDCEIVNLIKGETEVYTPEETSVVPAGTEEDDFVKIRETSFDLMEVGREALVDLANVAKESQHPRAYEVLSTLIKTISEVGRDLMDMHDQRKNAPKGKDKASVQQTTINTGDTNIIQVNPAQLLDLVIKKEKENS